MKPRTSPRLPLLAALLALATAGPLFAAAKAPTFEIDTGIISGASYAIAHPTANWNLKVLLIAHGYRPDSAPLIADLHPERLATRALINEGWIVATTSYRRNGLIVADAIEDLDALRAQIVTQFGEPETVILEGESMGGLIVTLMAERDKGPYQGAIVFDATLYTNEPTAKVGLSLLPRIPLLFVATEGEALAAERYLTSLVARPDPVVQPELFLIKRTGHTNINQEEHLAAFRALAGWVERGREALPRPPENVLYFDATVPADPGPSTAVIHPDKKGFDTRVAEVDPIYGNMLLEAQAQDFEAAGIAPRTYFELKIGNYSHRTLYGRTYTDVKSGEWIAFPDADGRTVLAKAYGDAAGAARLGVGDTVTFRVLDPFGPPLR